MKVQGHKYILSKLVLLKTISNIVSPSTIGLNRVTMLLIKSIPSNMTTHIGKVFSSFCSWILDSDAIDHICLSLTHFTSYHKINPISIKLPNRNQVIANYSVIDNVLYIHNFTFNPLLVAN